MWHYFMACIIAIAMSSLIHLNISVNCDYKETCIMETLYEGSSPVICGGYFGCTQALITSADGNDIICRGSYSCYEARMIKQNNTASNTDIWCRALFSCAFVTLIRNVNGNVACLGELSCFESTIITEHAENSILSCAADRSCAKANVTNANIVYVKGHMGASEATFQSFIASSNNDNYNSTFFEQYYYFYGRGSGHGARIICANGHTCFVYCQSNGCSHLSLTCDGNCSFMYVDFFHLFSLLILLIF